MRNRPKQRGFTIIEVLIFLSISGFVFAAGIGQYSAQQRRVDFATGVRNLQADLVSLQTEVSSSYSPDLSSSHCAIPVASTVYTFGSSADNQDCIFLGKAFAFGGPGGSTDCSANNINLCSHYDTVPIIGKRQYLSATGDTVNSDSYTAAKPLALLRCPAGVSYTTQLACGTGTPALGSPSSTRPDVTERRTLSHNLGIYRAFIRLADGDQGGKIGGFAFVFRLNNSSTATYSSNDNGGLVDLAAYTSSSYLTNTETQTATDIMSLTDSQLNPPYGIALCLLSADDKIAVITIGAANNSSDIEVQPENKQDIGCTN